MAGNGDFRFFGDWGPMYAIVYPGEKRLKEKMLHHPGGPSGPPGPPCISIKNRKSQQKKSSSKKSKNQEILISPGVLMVLGFFLD